MLVAALYHKAPLWKTRVSITAMPTLSEQRANAVRTALIDMGTSSDRIGTRGYGESDPIAGNNAAGRQLNRRVEIVLSGEGGNIAPC